MADECLAAVPEIEGIDYTLQEYLELLKHIKQVCWRIHIFGEKYRLTVIDIYISKRF
jgi:hypothetical protein